ncbi:hypothetical protein EYF80_004402 [Liparis tanakae]|uniref:Uncharacterized protein n=1 Tax=Liparis tanakae TaxID=230148 RepID=A0A4Z2J5C5_9TELE|nr:hypothetical protein EYF80_004402 [Liparis tanakae]
MEEEQWEEEEEEDAVVVVARRGEPFTLQLPPVWLEMIGSLQNVSGRTSDRSPDSTRGSLTHLYEHGHVRLLDGLQGRLHQRRRGLQAADVPAEERADAPESVVLLSGDEPHQLLLPLVQDARQDVQAGDQLLPPPPAVLLRGGRRLGYSTRCRLIGLRTY